MIQTIRQVKSRIRSIENIRKLTRAMEMVSSAKFSAVENKQSASLKYFYKIEALLKDALPQAGGFLHPLLASPRKKEKALLCVVASDTGLCASYNHNILKLAEGFLRKNNFAHVELVVVGRKAFRYFSRAGFKIASSFLELHGRFSQGLLSDVDSSLKGKFTSETADEVYVAYTHFESASRHKPRIEKVLNIEFPQGSEKDFIFEPQMGALLNELIPAYFNSKIRIVLLDAFSCEHASRMIAMGEATMNARELLEGLILTRNKMRQEIITREIMEVISTAEALRG